MLAPVKRCALATQDWLRYHPVVRGVLSRYKLWTDRVAPCRSDQALARSIVKLCAAARLTPSDEHVRRIQARIVERAGRLSFANVAWSEFVAHLDIPRIGRSVLLKPWLGPREKGVLFIAFEKEWFKLLCYGNLREFADRYRLVVAPSSSPHNLMNYVFAAAYPGPLFTLMSNESDHTVLPRVSANFVVVPLYASHWVNPQLFRPLPRSERDVDLIMVASFGKVKRHHALFRAIRKIPRRLRVLLVGQDQDDRNAATIRAEAECYGVSDRVTVQSNATYEAVAAALCRARASVILSRREGSCVVVAESLFADTPVALLADAEIGSRAFINPATGRLLGAHDLARQLDEFVTQADQYQPRAWAQDHISCFHSTRILNEVLRQHAEDEGDVWTQDLFPLCWRPDPALLAPEDVRRLQKERQEFKDRFDVEVGPYPVD